MKKYTKRYILLDLIRVIAAAMVVWFHVALSTGLPGKSGPVIPGYYYFSLGNIAVTIFLVLSGMVLGLTYNRKKVGWWQFFSKRLKSIYVVYLPALIVAVGILVAKNLIYTHAPPLTCDACTIKNVACSAVGFCAFLGEWGGPFMRTSWFIGLILSLYAFFPLLFAPIARRPYTSLFVLLVVSLLSKALIGEVDIFEANAIEWFPLARMFEFAVGIYLSQRVSESFLTTMNTSAHAAVIGFLSVLSFPVFLIHYELEFVIALFRSKNVPLFLSIILYVVITLLLSYVVLLFSRFFGKQINSKT